tara:strand:+ start:230 stop:1315 length:1086 start_codon:yes stop_codon:yes gene_type:complete
MLGSLLLFIKIVRIEAGFPSISSLAGFENLIPTIWNHLPKDRWVEDSEEKTNHITLSEEDALTSSDDEIHEDDDFSEEDEIFHIEEDKILEEGEVESNSNHGGVVIASKNAKRIQSKKNEKSSSHSGLRGTEKTKHHKRKHKKHHHKKSRKNHHKHNKTRKKSSSRPPKKSKYDIPEMNLTIFEKVNRNHRPDIVSQIASGSIAGGSPASKNHKKNRKFNKYNLDVNQTSNKTKKNGNVNGTEEQEEEEQENENRRSPFAGTLDWKVNTVGGFFAFAQENQSAVVVIDSLANILLPGTIRLPQTGGERDKYIKYYGKRGNGIITPTSSVHPTPLEALTGPFPDEQGYISIYFNKFFQLSYF